MSRMFCHILPLIIMGGEMMRGLESIMFPTEFPVKISGDKQRKILGNSYSKIYSQPDYRYMNFLPKNTPRGSNIGVCNFKKI